MKAGISIPMFLALGLIPSALLGVDVAAKGGVIPDDSTADVAIVAGGESGDISLAADAVTIKTLTDATTSATIQIADGQALTVSGATKVQTKSSAKLTLAGAGTANLNAITISNGATLDLSAAAVTQTGTITMGGTSGNRGNLSVSSPVTGTGRLNLQTGILEVHDGGSLSRAFTLGGAYTASCWQDGGTVEILGYNAIKLNSYVGGNGWFYYQLSGGVLKLTETVYWSSSDGPASKPSVDSGYPCVFLEQTGGAVTGSGVSMHFPAGRYEKALWLQTGGTQSNASSTLHLANIGIGSTAALVLDGNVTSSWLYVKTAHNTDSRADIVLNNGSVLEYRAITAGSANSKSYISFNGGTVKVLNNTAAGSGLLGQSNAQETETDKANLFDRITVYEGGMKVDASNGGRTIYEAIEAPTGGGVSGAASLPSGSSFDGPPMVEIIGDGCGAVAYAEYDRATKTVTGLKIACPGNGYTWAKAVYMRALMAAGNAHTVRTNDCTVAASQVGGGFELLGGSLSLAGANSYAGETVISGGTLRPSLEGAIPSGSSVYIAQDAVLDLKDVTGLKVSLGSGAGSIERGKVVHTGLWKAKAADLLAGNVLKVRVGSQGSTGAGHLEFDENATFTVDDPSALDPEVDYTLLTVSHSISGTLPEVTGMPGWRLKKMTSPMSIVLSKKKGLLVVFR